MSITSFRLEMFEPLTSALAAVDWNVVKANAGLNTPVQAIRPIEHYEGRQYSEGKNPQRSYVEIYQRSALGLQASLANDNGARRWENAGTLWIQCFGTDASAEGLEIAENIATIAMNAYQGKSTENCAWFRNVRAVNLGSSGGWYQINVLVDYEYDEVR